MKFTRQEKLADHLTEIDEDLLHNAYEIDDAQKLADYARSRTVRPRKTLLFRRMAALAACLVLTVTATVALPAAFSDESTTDAVVSPAPDTDPESNQIVLPPVRVGTEGAMSGLLSADVETIELIYPKAEAIARIRIGNWLDETKFYSYFEAEVVELYSGTLPDSFILKQFASSRFTILGYPVFTHGTEFILFLVSEASTPEEGCQYPNDNTYAIWGGHPSVFEVIETSSGESYFVDRFHLIDKSEWIVTNHIENSSIVTNVSSALHNRDAAGQEYSANYSGIYSVSDFTNYLETMKNEGVELK